MCKEGYYYSSGSCIKCDKVCKTCEGSSDNCIECADNSRDLSRNCKCNIGKFSSTLHEICENNCSHKCSECEEVAGACISCADSNRELNNGC